MQGELCSEENLRWFFLLHIYNWNIIPGQALIPGLLPGIPDVPGACQTVFD